MSARSSVVLPIPPEFLARAARWAELRRWERRELGLELRRLGLSYAEIAAVIPVPKGTLSGWCRDLELAEHQRARLASLRPALLARREFGMRRRRAALERAERIRRAAREEARGLVSDPFWVAGVVAYWAEGSKRCNQVQFANSDPGMVRLFVAWASRYLGVDATRFRVQLHLHSGQEESERRAFWSTVAGLDESCFRKSFVKPEGTGHRKNVLYNGTVSIRVCRSADLLRRVMGWVDGLQEVGLGR